MLILLKALRIAYPEVTFTAGNSFRWSPETEEVFYKSEGKQERDKWALLHETGHALLLHKSYRSDIQLLKMEMEAWGKARELAQIFDIEIDEEHVQDCLDTYRDWLHARAICPTCTTRCLQHDNGYAFRCHNCHTSWNVTPSRFCRPYRSVSNANQTPLILAA